MLVSPNLLCQVKVSHPFFPDGWAKNLEVRPTNTAVRHLSAFMGVCRIDEKGFFLSVAGKQERLKKGLGPQWNLPIGIYGHDHRFGNYSDLPRREGAVNYTSNLYTKKGVCIWQSLKLVGDEVTIELGEKPLNVEAIQIFKLNDQLEMDLKYTWGPPVSQVFVNMGSCPEGAYEAVITSGKTTRKTRFFKSRSLSWRPPLFVFEWFSTSDDAKGKGPVQVEIPIRGRSAYWKYYVLARNGEDLPHPPKILPIKIEGKEIEFRLLERRQRLLNGRLAWVLVSGHPIPIKKQYGVNPIIEIVHINYKEAILCPDCLISNNIVDNKRDKYYTMKEIVYI